MQAKDFIKRGVQLIATLTGTFHGFLPSLAPPEEIRQSSSVKFASFILLIIFLTITVIARRHSANQRYRKSMWWAVGIFFLTGVVFFFVYQARTDTLTFLFPAGEANADRHVKGEVLTDQAREWKANHPGITDSELVDSFGGIPYKERVWPHESIVKAELRLTEYYVVLVVALVSAVLCLAEGLLTNSEVK